jgi:hypothetical protein
MSRFPKSRFPESRLLATSALALSIAGGGAALATPAAARTVYPIYAGGSGDIHNAMVCEPGEYIIGFNGRVGAWIDRVKLVCAVLQSSGSMGPRKTRGGMGGGGGAEGESVCPVGLITGIRYRLTYDGRMVEEISFGCTDGKTGKQVRKNANFGGVGHAQTRTYDNDCPEGEAAVGMQGNWGQHVNGIGLICDRLKIPK